MLNVCVCVCVCVCVFVCVFDCVYIENTFYRQNTFYIYIPELAEVDLAGCVSVILSEDLVQSHFLFARRHAKLLSLELAPAILINPIKGLLHRLHRHWTRTYLDTVGVRVCNDP